MISSHIFGEELPGPVEVSIVEAAPESWIRVPFFCLEGRVGEERPVRMAVMDAGWSESAVSMMV